MPQDSLPGPAERAAPHLSIVPALDASAHPGPSPDLATPGGLARVAFDSMGTRIECLAPAALPGAAEAARALFADWHARLTRFDPQSELSQLNARSGLDTAVSPFLFSIVERALRAAAATDGLFDPTLLRQIEHLGYDRPFALVMPDTFGSPVVPLPRGGARWRFVRLDAERHRIRLPEGTGIDLGGIAKGMAADAALEAMVGLGAATAAIDAGGDVAVAGEPSPGAGWPLSIELPEGARMVTLRAGALATSGVSRRWWRRGGQRIHHLLDPSTGLPVENGVWSVSVAAARCEQAEAAAKAAFVLGPGAGERFLDANGLPGLFVLEDGRQIEAGPWRLDDTAAGDGPQAAEEALAAAAAPSRGEV